MERELGLQKSVTGDQDSVTVVQSYVNRSADENRMARHRCSHLLISTELLSQFSNERT